MSKKRTPLTRERVLEAAAALLDEHGVEGVSMRKLAASLGVEAMSLYNHVKDKQDLLGGAADTLLARFDLPAEPRSWREVIDAYAQVLYQALVEHPSLVVLVASERASLRHPKLLIAMDRVLGALTETGLEPLEQVNAFRGLNAMCLGFAMAHTRGLTGTREQAQEQWEKWDSSEWMAGTFPNLAKLVPYTLQTSADDDFRFVLDADLDALSRPTKQSQAPGGQKRSSRQR